MEIYQQVLDGKKSSTQFPIEDPNLLGQYGLNKTRGNQDDTSSNIFKFELDHSKFDIENWRPVLQSTPTDYSIPDPAFVQVLAEAPWRGSGQQGPEAQTIRDLEREIRKLREENTALKKFIDFLQNDRK
jgi:hypothetical protein